MKGATNFASQLGGNTGAQIQNFGSQAADIMQMQQNGDIADGLGSSLSMVGQAAGGADGAQLASLG